MRIRRLDLLAFGAFSGARLELNGRPGVVDLVYGPNEAGKSTTLRAVSGLLFGIPERTKDAHRHAPSDLRVGGVLETAGGVSVDVIRRKGRKNTLRAPDDSPLDEGVLAPLLMGATQELFEGLFGLDHVRLRESAQAMLAGKGSVGESLFSAGVGGRGIHELSRELAREAEELFVPRARERKISRAITEVKDARDAVRQAATSPAKYLEQQRGLDEAVRGREALRARRTELVAEQAELTRVVTVLPGLRRRAEWLVRLGALGEVVDLPDDASTRRARALHDLEEAVREEARVAEQEAQCRARVSAIVFSEALLDVDEAIVADLRDRRGRYLSAQLDRPKLEAKALAIEESVRRSLSTIGAEATATGLHLSVAGAARIRSLATRRQRLEQTLEAARRALEEARARRARLALGLAVAAGADHERAAIALGRLRELALPTVTLVDRFAEERASLDSEQTRLSRERDRLTQQRRDVERRLDELRRLGDIPTEAELGTARVVRDRMFEDLREGLTNGPSPPPAVIQTYQAALATTDTIADRLRREARQVASRAALEADREALDAELGANESVQQSTAARAQASELGWLDVWKPIGVTPRSPREMKSWAAALEALVALEPELARLDGEVGRALSELDDWRQAWVESVKVLGLAGEPTEEEAFAVLDEMTRLVREVEVADGLRRRVEGIARDSASFADEVLERCRVHLPAAATLAAAEAAERFVRSVELAREGRAERTRLETELVALDRSRGACAARRKDAEARLSSLVAAARVDGVELLEDAERRSTEARAIREHIRSVEDELLVAGDGVALQVLETETRGRDSDRARARLRELTGDLEELDDQTSTAGQDIGHLEHGVHSMEHTDAAEASALLEDRVACLKRHAHRYVRVRLASVILSREIERYREANQGPIVARANELFPRLTVGRYSALRVGYDSEGTAVLLAVRPDGSTVGVDGMSDGTRDQLYLALRLASLERYARTNEPMPLVLDDVLIHSDEERARAVLVVLGEVARTTQVLFFTHSARLAELARSALGPTGLAEHALPETR